MSDDDPFASDPCRHSPLPPFNMDEAREAFRVRYYGPTPDSYDVLAGAGWAGDHVADVLHDAIHEIERLTQLLPDKETPS
jgi:hypothetical protein